ncbi:hypothetical protein SDC9_137976 [bioreactor metagenome]|uniref:Uncharacterized protein n=1 Tax=bioreactor metagenome TaxID=1076179 RepID=A0A645DPZ5_9ZZZZ
MIASNFRSPRNSRAVQNTTPLFLVYSIFDCQPIVIFTANAVTFLSVLFGSTIKVVSAVGGDVGSRSPGFVRLTTAEGNHVCRQQAIAIVKYVVGIANHAVRNRLR